MLRTLVVALAVVSMAAGRADGQTVGAAAQSDGLSKSTDGGQSWSHLSNADAIAVLREWVAAAPAYDDARLLLGTVLSWEGQYDEARTHLRQVVADHPTDGDALSALVNVELWSDHPREAKRLAEVGLRLSPQNSQFMQGRQRAVAAIDRLRPWEVSASENYDWFGAERGAWHEQQGAVRRATPVGAVIVRGSRAERFGLTDNQVEVEMYPKFRAGTYAYLAAGWAPDQVLYPEFRLAADVYQTLGAGYEGSFGFRRLGFSTRTNIFVGSLNKYVGNWLLTGRMFYIPDRTGATSRSYHGSVRHYFGADGKSYVGARYSRGSAREEVRNLNDFEVLNSNTAGVELDTAVSGRLRLAVLASTSRQDRANQLALRQNSLSVTLGMKF